MIKLGILGFGFIGKIHFENIQKFSNVEISSIFSNDNERENLPKDIRFYLDYEEMLSQEVLDAILICTPTFTHQKIACECAQQGIKNIFLEKPMALSIEECNTIRDTIREYKSNLLMGHVLRFWPTYASVQKYITEPNSKLGELQSINAKRLQTFPWSQWFANQEKSGGVILDLSIHDIDYAIWLLGNPVSVISDAKVIKKHNMSVIGEATTKLKFKDDKIAECEASWAKSSEFQFYAYTKIIGTESSIELDGAKIFNNELFKITNPFPSEDGYYNQIKHFIDEISNRTCDFRVSGEDGKNSIKMCLAAIKSAMNNGKEIYIDEIE